MRIVMLVGLMAAVLCSSARAQTPSVLVLGFKADVLADGSLADIKPDASLTPMLQSMLRKRVAAWRYGPGTWQGKPVSGSISQQIEAEPVPVPSGGFALRIQKVRAALPSLVLGTPGYMHPPAYPAEALRSGVQGTFVYAVRADAQGKPYDIELVAPERLDRSKRMLDVSARAAIAQWTMITDRSEGVPTNCRALVPVEFALGSRPDQRPADLAAPYRARYADACPAAPKLLTDVVGTLL